MGDGVSDLKPGLWWGDVSGRTITDAKTATDLVLYWNGEKVAYIWRCDYATEAGYLWCVIGLRNDLSPKLCKALGEPYYAVPFAACDNPMKLEDALTVALRYVIDCMRKTVRGCAGDCECLRHEGNLPK